MKCVSLTPVKSRIVTDRSEKTGPVPSLSGTQSNHSHLRKSEYPMTFTLRNILFIKTISIYDRP